MNAIMNRMFYEANILAINIIICIYILSIIEYFLIWEVFQEHYNSAVFLLRISLYRKYSGQVDITVVSLSLIQTILLS